MSYFCELENWLFEAFEDKDDDMLTYIYKLRNTDTFETTSSLLSVSEYGFYKKIKTCMKLRRIPGVDLQIDEAAFGNIFTLLPSSQISMTTFGRGT